MLEMKGNALNSETNCAECGADSKTELVIQRSEDDRIKIGRDSSITAKLLLIERFR